MSVFLKEVVRNKLRLALVIVLVALLSYMAFTLGGMANGLYVGMVQAVQKMEGDLVVVSDRSGGSLTFSRITGDVLDKVQKVHGVEAPALFDFT